MKRYITVNNTTGEIVTNGTTQSLASIIPPPGHSVIESEARSGVDYWDWNTSQAIPMLRLEDVVVFDRWEIDVSNDEILVINGIPTDTTVVFAGEAGLGITQVINDGVINYDTDKLGEHLFAFFHPRYKSWVGAEVQAV